MTPIELDYRWPAEWERHQATWLAWPHNPETWPGRSAEARAEFVNFATTLASYEPVHVLAGGDRVRAEAEEWLGQCPQITLWDIPTNDAWIRDYGPLFLKEGERSAIVDWGYNAWGNKYPPFDDDAAAARLIREEFQLPGFSPPMILEGGSVEGNGQGLLMTTRTCLLHKNRNPHLTVEIIEKYLQQFLACHQVIWLDGEIAGDDTDGHIDQLARFVAPDVVVVASEENQGDDNYVSLAQLRRQLESTPVIGGTAFQLVDLPMPSPVYHETHRLPASYANFYIANNAVLVPQFEDRHDAVACEILRGHFPSRDIVGLPCRELVWGLGGFHCLTQQQPA